MREWGHKFLYDEETLRATLESIGFEALARTFNQSDEPRLRGLDSRDRAAGSHSMYFDCYRP
jgi:hypothetical protein